MAGKPKTIVLKSDDQKKFGPEVFDLIRTGLTPKIGGNVKLGVKLAAEAFAPRMPATVTVAEMGDAISQIVVKFEAESSKQPINGNDGRLPLNDEAQKLWDSGEWRGKLTVHGLRERFKAEITDGVDLTASMINAYAADQVAEKAKVVELVSERDDPDSKPVACESPAHRGDEKSFQPSVAHKLFRNDAGQLERQKHNQGDEYILVGNFLVLKDEEGRVSGQAAYCADCRDAAREMARNAEPPIKLTFYTASGAKRVQEAATRSAETNEALMSQLKSAGARTFGVSYGTRKVKGDWRVTRGGIGTHKK